MKTLSMIVSSVIYTVLVIAEVVIVALSLALSAVVNPLRWLRQQLCKLWERVISWQGTTIMKLPLFRN